MNADGTGRLQITSDAERGAVLPTWFPDGRHILYIQHNNIPRYNLQSLDVDTRQSSLVTEFPNDPGKPQLSPDGSQLAISPAVNGVINIWLVDMTTRKLRQLTFDKQMIGFPSWSPDGKRLAAELRRGEDDHLVLIDVATGQIQEVVHDHAKNWVNSWSRDGDKLIYAKFDVSGVWNIWSYSRSTGIEKRLTHYSDLNGYVRYPTISPHGNQIAYEHTITAGNIWMMEFK
jgi:TolB protein